MLDDQKKTDSAPATPEEWRAQLNDIKDSVEKLTKTLSGHADEGAKDLQKFELHLAKTGETIVGETRKTLVEMRESLDGYVSMKKLLDARDEEIKRLKAGYDKQIFRDFLRKFAEIDETAREYAKTAETSGISEEDARKRFRMISDLLEDALYRCGVTRFSPTIGNNWQNEFGVTDNPETAQANNADKDYQIKEILSEGYKLELPDGESEPIINAKVKIFKHQKEN